MPKVPPQPLTQQKTPAKRQPPTIEKAAERIAPGILSLAVPISTLVHDPQNARLHGDRNMEAIRASLRTYGQLKPVVVRAQNRVVVAGNGTMRAARELGWIRIAAVVVPMTEVEAAGYGLADNRTAELADWDHEVVARLHRFLQEEGAASAGWSAEEIAALRRDDFMPPPEEFPEIGEDLATEHECPKCGYKFSGGKQQAVSDSVIVEDDIPF